MPLEPLLRRTRVGSQEVAGHDNHMSEVPRARYQKVAPQGSGLLSAKSRTGSIALQCLLAPFLPLSPKSNLLTVQVRYRPSHSPPDCGLLVCFCEVSMVGSFLI